MSLLKGLLTALVFLGGPTLVAQPQYLLPLNCSELLPQEASFLSYFESVGKGQVATNKKLSERIFRILALRDQLQESSSLIEDRNPIDELVRRTLCFYRQQKDALSPVPFDSPEMVSFIGQNIRELESKVEAVILEIEYRKASQDILKRKAQRHQRLVDKEKQIAARKARELFETLSRKAVNKAKKES